MICRIKNQVFGSWFSNSHHLPLGPWLSEPLDLLNPYSLHLFPPIPTGLTTCSCVLEVKIRVRTSPTTSTSLWEMLELKSSKMTMSSKEENILHLNCYGQSKDLESLSSFFQGTMRLRGGAWRNLWRSWSAEELCRNWFYLYSMMLNPRMWETKREVLQKHSQNMKSITCWTWTKFSGGDELCVRLLICQDGI